MFIEKLKYCILLSAAITLTIPIIGIMIAGIKNGVFKFFDKVFKSRGAAVSRFIYGVLLFPGTVFHECSHALGALLTGARVRSISVIPEKGGSSIGQTIIEPRGTKLTKALQLSVSATSPVSFGIAALAAGILLLYPVLTALWQKIIFTYLLLAVFFHMSMSTEDIKAWVKGIAFVFVLIFLVFLLLIATSILPLAGLAR